MVVKFSPDRENRPPTITTSSTPTFATVKMFCTAEPLFTPSTFTNERPKISTVETMRCSVTDRFRPGNKTAKLLANAVAIMAITARKLPKIIDQPYMKEAPCPNASSMYT